MNTSNYFPHNNNARNDEKIIGVRMDFGCEGYGIYFMLLERLSESDDYTCAIDYKRISFDFHCAEDKVKSIVENYGLFEFSEDGKRFYSASFNERMKKIEERREKAIEQRRRAAESRWGKKKEQDAQENNATASENDATALKQNATAEEKHANIININKRKGKENKKKKDNTEGTNVPTSVKTDSRQLAIPVDDDESESVKEEKQPAKTEKPRAKENVNWQKLVEYWNETTAGSFPPITNIENKRRQMAAARIAEYGKEKFIEAIQRAVQSDFLRGQNQRGFTLTFDWLIRPNNFPKVLEGNYDNSTTRTQTTIDNGTGRTKQRNAKFADFGETMEAIRLGINAGLAERDNITGGGQ